MRGIKVLSIAFAVPSSLALVCGASRLLAGANSGFILATRFGWGMSGNAEIAMVVIGLAGLITAYGLWNLKKWALMAIAIISILNLILGLDVLVDVMNRFDALALLFGLFQITISAAVMGYLVKVRKVLTKID